MESWTLSRTDDNHRWQLLFWAVFSLLLGLGFIFYGFVVFGYLTVILPWLLTGCGLLCWFRGVMSRKNKRSHAYTAIVAGAVIFCCGIILFKWAQLRDGVLWYIFVLYLIFSAYFTMRPAWRPGLEKYAFSRWLGGLTVWGFAVLLLLMPRSGLSDALQLLGIFSAAWGVYQIMLPPVRE